MSKQTLSSNAAREALQKGIDAVVNPVKVTLGPRGRNVLIDRPGQPLATRDGVTVAKECAFLIDPYENMGAQYAREVADAQVTETGDGTTTACVILQAIVREGLKLVSAGAEPLHLADGIEAAATACAETIKKLAIPATPELVEQVAIISTHGDKELGAMIAKATMKVGAAGVIELGESRNHETTIEHMEGFYFERGWRGQNGANQVFVNDLSGARSVLRDPFVLISERVITGCAQGPGDHLYNVLSLCAQARKPILIVAEDLIGDAYNVFTANVAAGTVPGGCFVKLPGFGDSRAAAVTDLQIAVGVRRIHSLASTSVDDMLSTFTLNDLGTCKEAIISPTRTVLIEGQANRVLLPQRIKQLIQQSQESGNPFEKEMLDHRIARLTGGVAVLKVGGNSEPAMLEKKARAEDAIHACRGALTDGIVPGGGVALLRASAAHAGGRLWEVGGDLARGSSVLFEAIMEPSKQIARNAGYDPEQILKALLLPGEDTRTIGVPFGFNAATGDFGNMLEMGIVDPAKVVLTALRKAASIGALLLTTEVLVTDVPQQNQPAGVKSDFRM